MGRPRKEHRSAHVTIAVDERDVIELRALAQEKHGTIDRYGEIIREAIAEKLRRAGRLRRDGEAMSARNGQSVLWFGVCPPIEHWHRVRGREVSRVLAMSARVEPPARFDITRKIGGA